MIEIQVSKSTGKAVHIDGGGKKTEIKNIPPKASLKAVLASAKAMGLRIK
ncbi:hypothetical protein KAR91_84765 [Candidatus Pacearchaeota archaeon]|nr:hypothetical protein [Candidatus Pacearchaeota archaeon]